ncbi:MAG: hypothetical protein D6710_08325 [Nitrospirae bacterium]|nr:MAG: hypothetical protein D6710_08325 [Nitrospirota bacterium]
MDSNLLKKAIELEKRSLFKKVFSEAISSEGLSRVKVRYVGLSHTKGIEKPAEEGFLRDSWLASSLNRKKILGVSLKQEIFSAEGELFQRPRTLYRGKLAEKALQSLAGTPRGSLALNIMWDTRLTEPLITTRSLPTEKLPISISAKGLLKRFFPDIKLQALRQEDVLKAAMEAAEKGASGSAEHLGEAYKLLGSPKDISAVPELILHAAFLKAQKSPEGSAYGLRAFKQMLSDAGVPGLSGVERTIFSTTDPYGLARIVGIKPSTKNYSAYLSGSHGDTNAFLDVVEEVAGRRYRLKLGGLIERTMQNTKGRIAFAMKEGALFVGQHGVLKSFVPLPVQLSEPGLGVSKAGLQSGIVNFGGRLASAKPIRRGEKITSFSEEALELFEKGLQQLEGYSPKNLPVAIRAAYQYMRHQPIPGIEKTYQELTSAVISRGEFSLFRPLYEQATSVVGGEPYAAFFNALDELQRKVARGEIKSSDRQALVLATEAAINQLPDWVDKSSISAVKLVSSGKAQALPERLMSHFFIPGALMTERAQRKGLYAAAGTLPVWRTEELRAIQSSLERLGLAGVTRTVGIAPARRAAEKILTQVFRSESVFGKAFGVRGGFRAVSLATPSVVAVLDTKLGDTLFGDAAAILTQEGQRYISGRLQPALQKELDVSPSELLSTLRGLAGKHANEPGWQKLLQQVEAREITEAPVINVEGLPIERGSKFAPRGANKFMGIKLNRANPSRVQFYFGRQYKTDVIEGLLAEQSRVTASVPFGGQRMLESQFGALSRLSHFMTTPGTIEAAGAINVAFHHRTGLLSTKAVIERFGSREAAVREFHKEFIKAGGTGLKLVDKGTRLTTTARFEPEKFLTASEKALRKLGFTPAQIEGYAFAQGRHNLGMIALLGGGDYETTEAMRKVKGLRENARLLILPFAQREGATEEILKQEKAFRIRLENLNLLAQTDAYQSPYLKMMKAEMEAQTGIRLSQEAGVLAPHQMVRSWGKKKAGEIRNIIAPFVPSVGNIRQYASKKGIDILSVEEAAERFGKDLTMGAVKEGMPYEAFRETALMKQGRKGFYIDLGAEFAVPAGITREGKRAIAHTRYVYVPRSSDIMVPGAEGAPVTVFEGSLTQRTIKLIEALKGRPDERVRAVREYFEKVTGLSGKAGVLDEALTARMASSAKGRIVSGFSSIYKAAADVAGGPIPESVFTVGVSKEMLAHMFTDPKTGKLDKKGLRRVLKKLEKPGGYVYGALIPRPTHEIGQMMEAKIVLHRGLKGEAVAMHDFLAYAMERDFDKDTIDVMLSVGRRNSRIRNILGISNKDLQDSFERQRKALQKLYEDYVKKQEDNVSAFSNLFKLYQDKAGAEVGTKAYFKNISAFLAFGKVPSLPFTHHYPTLALTGALVSPFSEEKIADELTRLSKNVLKNQGFTKEEIKLYREALGITGETLNLAPEDVWLEAGKLQKNVFQSPITKGSEYLESLIGDYMATRSEVTELVKSGGTLEEAIELAEQKARTFFEEIRPKLKTSSLVVSAGVDPVEFAAKVMGRVQGVSSYIFATKYKPGLSTPNVMRGALGGKEHYDSISRMAELFFDEADVPVTHSAVDAVTEATEKLAQGGSEVVKEAKAFGLKNWRAIAAIGGGFLALRGLMNIFGREDLEPPPMWLPPVPLPAEPDVSRPDPGPVVALPEQKAYLAQPRNNYSNASYTANVDQYTGGSSQFNGNITAGFVGSYDRVEVRDSRAYASSYELQARARQYEDSDYIHPYMS